MLNRRIIRGKVLQQLFAYKTCQAANIELATDNIIATFSPNLNSDVPQDVRLLEKQKNIALAYLKQFIECTADDSSLPTDIAKPLLLITKNLTQQNLNDRNAILKNLFNDCEQIFDQYLACLSLLFETAEKLFLIKKNNKLLQNKGLMYLKNTHLLTNELQKKNITWQSEQDMVLDLVNHIDNDDVIDSKDETEVLSYVFKEFMYKNATFNEYFESHNISWQEDKVAIKDMVLDSIKAATNNDAEFEIPQISKNWPDDKVFMQKLFETSIDHEFSYQNYISPKLKNWDISRLTLTDSLIMKMCVAEMIHFPAIPVKVSLNEYIELAKRYSTPKSKILINGVLDKVSSELVRDGVIKKSGRGLIDNK